MENKRADGLTKKAAINENNPTLDRVLPHIGKKRQIKELKEEDNRINGSL